MQNRQIFAQSTIMRLDSVQESDETRIPILQPFPVHRADSKIGKAQASSGTATAGQNKALVVFYAVGHCLCAGSLSVINKWALEHYAHPFALTFLQLSFASAMIFTLATCRIITWEPPNFQKMKRYLPAAAMFLVTLVGSNRILAETDVNTFVVVRATIPIFCAFLEILVLDTPIPPKLSFLMLILLVAGVAIYVQSNFIMVEKFC
jgi:drug/metabolite transporter (DMT)-like permease